MARGERQTSLDQWASCENVSFSFVGESLVFQTLAFQISDPFSCFGIVILLPKIHISALHFLLVLFPLLLSFLPPVVILFLF